MSDLLNIVYPLIISILVVLLVFSYQQILKLKKDIRRESKTVKTIEAQQILHDLTAGEALVRIIPISPNDVFLRSPK